MRAKGPVLFGLLLGMLLAGCKGGGGGASTSTGGGGTGGGGGTPANSAPTVSAFSLSPNPASAGVSATFSWTVSDPDGDTLTCQIDADGDGNTDYTVNGCATTTSQAHTFSKVTTGLSSGDSTLTAKITVTDGKGGSAQKTVTLSVELPKTACASKPRSAGGDDSFKGTAADADNPNGWYFNNDETIFFKSHHQGTPAYGQLTPRYKLDGTPVTIDYMVHSPSGTPKALVVLIAGGALKAGIKDADGDGIADASRGNFLVRSAHRFMKAGYRVVTVDRPSDYTDYGYASGASSPGYLYDAYRIKMDHAVDLAAIIQAENSAHLPVVIAGTSRGAISAVAQGLLASAIALSSPVTADAAGSVLQYPVGSAEVPVSSIKRSTHLLIHTNDRCTNSDVKRSRDLFNQIVDLGVAVRGDEVSGGFYDTVRNDACGAFDYHGFTGIETCAVERVTTWMDGIVVGGNAQPIAQNVTINLGDPLTLSAYANDPDGDPLTYRLPGSQTVLGGNVSVDASSGAVTYTAPSRPSGQPATKDAFAYVVEDGKGGVATAVVYVNLPAT